MTDGTLFAANAALNSLIPREKNKLNTDSTLHKNSQQRTSNKTHVSQTDPEASLAFKRGKARSLKYKAHLTIDAHSRVILDTKITTGSCHDSKVYLEQLQAIQQNHPLIIREAIADRAYGSGQILDELIKRQIKPTIPLCSSRSGGTILKQADGFVYEEENDRYRCLADKYLVPYPALSDGRITYHSNAKECATCTIWQTCKAMFHSTKGIRIVNRNRYQKLFEMIQQQSATDTFRQKLKERFWKVEGIISEAKQHGLSRARYRGLIKTQIQAYLSASVQNMKRLIIAFLFHLFAYSYLKMI